MRADMTVFTIGHGVRALEELVETLSRAGVQTIVDVRRFPGSRPEIQDGRLYLCGSLVA